MELPMLKNDNREPLLLDEQQQQEMNLMIENELLTAESDPLRFLNSVSSIIFDDSSASDENESDALFPELATTNSTIDVQPDDIDSMVAKEIASLSVQDREKVFSDVHGVSGTVEETSELVRISQQQLQLELDKLEDCPAFHTARKMDPAYVQAERFRLMFLRADLFDAKKAAMRMGKFFKIKLELFGRELLTKTITQDCLDEESLRALYLGNVRLLEERDSAGRALLVNFLADTDVSVNAKLKAAFYTVMLAVEDIETQRRGCVGVSYLIGKSPGWLQLSPHRREWNTRMGLQASALPFRVDGMHVCRDSFATRVLFAIFKLGGAKDIRLRSREHYGTRQECLFSLQTFGIPTHCLPIDNNGNILTERHIDLMEKRRKLERLCQNGTQAQVRISVPSRNDVLFGRGKAFYRHVGNMRLRAMVEERSPEYEASKVADKQRIKDEVVEAIHKLTGRFLRDDGAGWVEVSDSEAGKKVSHAFRTLRGLKLCNEVQIQKDVRAQGVVASSKAQLLKRGRLD